MDVQLITSAIAVGLGGLAVVGLLNWRKYKSRVEDLELRESDRLWALRTNQIQNPEPVKAKRKYTRKPKPAINAEQASPPVQPNGAYTTAQGVEPASAWPFPTESDRGQV